MATLKLKFEAELDYQAAAVQAVVELFADLPLARSQFSLESRTATLSFSELGVGNLIPSDAISFEAATLANLRVIQERNGLSVSEALDGMHFSIEMETGTGKTYVYLRTIFELNKRYGFTKFVIVVPNVAIREGVLASIALLRDHLRGLYDNVPCDAAVYDSKHLGRVRQFATANSIQLLVMNIQAFQKDVDDNSDSTKANIINRAQDGMSGYRPIDFIQATHPVVVIDEPQNMESEAASEAIARLRPLCTLRYSATHKRAYNAVYRLGPVDAYDMNLVKRIEVASVVADENPNAAFVRLVGVDAARERAQLLINHGRGSTFKEKKRWVKCGTDLAVASAGRQEYADGWIVSGIVFRSGAETVEFTNGADVTITQASAAFDEDVQRAQVVETVRQHLDKERALAAMGVKVLSLFFVDRVANYRDFDDEGNPTLGRIGRWFEQAYTELAERPRYAALDLPPVKEVHGGYFSVDNNQRLKDTRGESAADVDTYDLIMRDKERLLSPAEPMRFIFSHSALREGWDNPNVFQICTLNESRTAERKRQEIGRGLRLAVNQHGERIRDRLVNRLTVIANEAYEQFARGLQTEYEQDTGERFGCVPKEAFAKLTPPPDDGRPPEPFGRDVSYELWEHLRAEGYLDSEGAVTTKFAPSREDFQLSVPHEMECMRAEITDAIARYVFVSRIVDARKRQAVRFRKQVMLGSDFKALWDRISKRTKYRVSLSSDEVVGVAARAIAHADAIEPPKVQVRVVELEQSVAGISTDKLVDERSYDTAVPLWLPDILADLQNETDLTRATLVRVLRESGRLADFTINPQAFTVLAASRINGALHKQMVDGIRYEPVPGLTWEMHRLEPEASEEVERYAARLYRVQNLSKVLYDHVEIDSEVERAFAKGLDGNLRVRFFMKLPGWFVVDTPIGPYNPDWAIVFDASERVYLVRETKGSIDPDDIREREQTKIRCAREHFDAIGVDYEVTTSVEDMLSRLSGS